MRRLLPAVVVLTAAVFAAAQPPKDKDKAAPKPPAKGQFGPAYEEEPYGQLPDTTDKAGKAVKGARVTKYTLVGRGGAKLMCVTYGATITELHVPDKDGKLGDVVLGCGSLADYVKGHPFFGTNAGRCGNRIAKGQFTLDGKGYTLAVNNGPNHLHGGTKGFDKQVWAAAPFLGAAGPGVTFTYVSKDGEEGYPGTLTAQITYTLTDANGLHIDMKATADKPTVCNLAHHSYFNLAGHDSGDVKGHQLFLNAARYTPADDTDIPTGKIEPVAGTPFDFTAAKPLGQDLAKAGGKEPNVGYDLNFVVDGVAADGQPRPAARVTDPASGRTMTVLTTEPGIQLYTGNYLDGTTPGKGGARYTRHTGFCLEAQRFPDSVNKPEWKDISNAVLRPGETYRQTTVYQFGITR